MLGASDEAGHWQLSDVAAGERFAFQGRVFETADVDADGALEVRWSGDVLGRVVNTFVRLAPEVIDAEVAYDDGTTDTLTGTPNHPFWVDAVRDYVPLGELEVGTALHVQGGGEAILVSKTWRQGDFEVFDFEVEGLHNFYVRGEGSDAAGVLVHNSTGSTIRANKAKGEAFEAAEAAKLQSQGYDVGREVTVETASGTRTRLDIVATKGDEVRCIECKSSATAPLTKNQEAGFPEIAESGATVKGKGKPNVPGGTKIDPTEVEIIRPD